MNKAIFVDTAYVYAVLSPRDQWHRQAVLWQEKIISEKLPLIITEFVLMEIADGLAAINYRQTALQTVRLFYENPVAEIVPASSELFAQALNLYEQRHDKSWGLTDCKSFVVMNENNLTQALTTDDHFRQAGFEALLLN